MPAWYAKLLEDTSTTFTLIFILEMGVKLVAFGWHGYWASRWNVLDGTIAIVSALDFVLMLSLSFQWSTGYANPTFLRFFRMVRVLRMLRILKVWNGLYQIVMTLARALPQMWKTLVLMLFSIVVFALLGKELFGGKLSDGEVPTGGGVAVPYTRYHFDSFFPAVVTTFLLMTGKWHQPMVDTVWSVGLFSMVYLYASRASNNNPHTLSQSINCVPSDPISSHPTPHNTLTSTTPVHPSRAA